MNVVKCGSERYTPGGGGGRVIIIEAKDDVSIIHHHKTCYKGLISATFRELTAARPPRHRLTSHRPVPTLHASAAKLVQRVGRRTLIHLVFVMVFLQKSLMRITRTRFPIRYERIQRV